MPDKSKGLFLSPKKIQRKTLKGIKKYEKLNFFEQFAMFMGVAQLLEIDLKNLLTEKYDYDLDELEKWTLGRLTNELEKNNLRQDFIILLKSVVEYRNYIAHELLANEILKQAILKGAGPKNHYSKELRQLHKAIYELEQIVFLFNWTQKNKAWE